MRHSWSKTECFPISGDTSVQLSGDVIARFAKCEVIHACIMICLWFLWSIASAHLRLFLACEVPTLFRATQELWRREKENSWTAPAKWALLHSACNTPSSLFDFRPTRCKVSWKRSIGGSHRAGGGPGLWRHVSPVDGQPVHYSIEGGGAAAVAGKHGHHHVFSLIYQTVHSLQVTFSQF